MGEADERRSLVRDLRGATRLAVEATEGVTDLVQAMHHGIVSGPFAGVARALSAPAYAWVRGVTGVVGAGLDRALAQLESMLDVEGPDSPLLRAVLNGVLGDYLAATANPLAIEMSLRRAGPPPTTGRVLVLLHGSCLSHLQWNRGSHDHGAALEQDLGFAAVYLHYNTGLHVSTNGRAFAAELQALVDAWPVPVTEIVLLGHSMGGLVSRSAVHVADEAGLGWRQHLRSIVFLGTPHHGSPVERSGNVVDALLESNRYSGPLARLGQIRSGGVTDLRYGNVVDADWEGRDRFERGPDARTLVPLPEGVACFAVAGTLTDGDGSDGLVPVASALGRHELAERTFHFAGEAIVPQTSHLGLLDRRVYDVLRGWLGA